MGALLSLSLPSALKCLWEVLIDSSIKSIYKDLNMVVRLCVCVFKQLERPMVAEYAAE